MLFVCSVMVFGVIGLIGDSMMDLLWVLFDCYCVEVLIVNSNVVVLVKFVKEFFVCFVVVVDMFKFVEFKVVFVGMSIECGVGESVVIEVGVCLVDWVMVVVSGVVGLKFVFVVVDCGVYVVFVNKECLVCVGDFFM